MEHTIDRRLHSVPFRYFLERHRHPRRDRPAIIDGVTGETITYGALHGRVSRVAGALTARGIRRGDRVACLSVNSKAYTEILLALGWIGAVAVPLNTRLSASELAFIIGDCGARAIFACASHAATAESAVAAAPAVATRILDGPASGA